MFNLSGLYEEGHGVKKDMAAAVKWNRKAVDGGLPIAETNLGRMYLCGCGVLKDESEGVRWLMKAARRGEKDAQNRLGNCYFEGWGVKQDKLEAAAWWTLSAGQGEKDAIRSLQDLAAVLTTKQMDATKRRAASLQPKTENKSRAEKIGNAASD